MSEIVQSVRQSVWRSVRRALASGPRYPSARLAGWLRLVFGVSLLAALVLAAAGASCEARRAPLLVFALDVSSSVEAHALEAALERVETLSARAPRATLLAFADRAVSAASPDALRALPLFEAPPAATAEGGVWRGRSDLEAALDLATAHLERADPARRRPWRIVLLTDGVETSGSVARVLPRLRRTRVRTDTVPLATTRNALESSAPRTAARAHAGEPLVASLELSSDREREVEITLLAGSEVVAQRRFDLLPGDNRVSLPARLPRPGAIGLRARVAAPDEPDTIEIYSPPSFVLVGEPRRAWIVADDSAPSPLLRQLGDLGWETRRMVPEALDRRALATTEAVVLDDVAAQRLGPQAMIALHDFVLAGGGMLFLAGPSTFGEEGYSKTPLEEVLPLRFNVEEERTDVALMIALDKSYSMKGEKMELAKEAAKAVVGELQDDHRFGVVAFDWNPYRIVDLQPARNREQILDAIRRIEASAQTNFYPALESCLAQLQAVEAKVKHVILISDGRTYPDEYQRLIQTMRAAEITVSTVGVGAEADDVLLADIARWGGGAAYLVSDPSRVQQILLDEARSKTEDTVVDEPTPLRLVTSVAALQGIDVAAAPPLLGHVTLEAHRDAEVVLATADDKPVLARRNVGLGRTWMFAADLGGRFTPGWRAWPDAARLASQVLHDAVARGGEHPYELAVEPTPGGFEVSLSAHGPEGGPNDGLGVVLEALRDDGDVAVSLALEQVAPGRYRGFLDEASFASEPGELLLRARVGDRAVAGQGLRPPARREQLPGPPDTVLLAHVAATTGGRFDPTDDEILEHRDRSATAWWPPFAVAALVLYLLELAVRRTGWPRGADDAVEKSRREVDFAA